MMDEIQSLITLFLWPFKADASSASEMKLINSCKFTYRTTAFKTSKIRFWNLYVNNIDQICKVKLAQSTSEKQKLLRD